MRVALALAARGLGQVAPNPAVGCVIVRDDTIVGRGWTQPGGRPHAETEALLRAGRAAAGATAYVTLEPCSHHGRTPPCADGLIAVGVRRVVSALGDPDPRVSGRGLERLRAAGIEVTTGVCEAEAARLNRGFLMRVEEGRPLVLLKLATSLDGRLATHCGESKWITGDPARAFGHLLRHQHDAIMVGSGTVLADDPELTVRLPGLTARQPLRIIVDGRLRTPLTAKLVAQARTNPTLLITLADAQRPRRRAYEDAGVTVLSVDPDTDGAVDLAAVLQLLGKQSRAGRRLRQDCFGPVSSIAWPGFAAPASSAVTDLPALRPSGLIVSRSSPDSKEWRLPGWVRIFWKSYNVRLRSGVRARCSWRPSHSFDQRGG